MAEGVLPFSERRLTSLGREQQQRAHRYWSRGIVIALVGWGIKCRGHEGRPRGGDSVRESHQGSQRTGGIVQQLRGGRAEGSACAEAGGCGGARWRWPPARPREDAGGSGARPSAEDRPGGRAECGPASGGQSACPVVPGGSQSSWTPPARLERDDSLPLTFQPAFQ